MPGHAALLRDGVRRARLRLAEADVPHALSTWDPVAGGSADEAARLASARVSLHRGTIRCHHMEVIVKLSISTTKCNQWAPAMVVEVPVCSVSFTDLFGGYRNAHSRRLWEDGLFTRIVRQASNNFAAQRAHTWVVLDGELDPVVSDLMCSLTALRSRQGGIFEATARCAAALQCIAASRLPLTHSHLPQGTATSKWQ